MLPLLPRIMLWTDKATMDEFFKLEPINEDFYEVFLHLREEPFAVDVDGTKVFNEVYYQVTRIVYEHPMPTDLGKYIADIKANLGWNYSAELVMTMAYFLLSLIDKNERPLNKFFTKSINEKFGGCLYWKPFKHLFERLRKSGRRVKYGFKPKPCEPKDLQSLYVDWRKITNQFNLSSLDHVVHLWNDKYRIEIAKLLADSLIDGYANKEERIQARSYLYNYREMNLFEGEQDSLSCAEPYISPEEQKLLDRIEVLENEKKAQQSRIVELEAENTRLNTLLEKKKNTTGKGRRFTLVQIVDYCKGCVTWEDAKSIVAMLNKLLRRIATEEDSDLVDSIETEFINRNRPLPTHKEIVLQKHVVTEIQNVEAGGTGVNNEIRNN